MTGNRFTRPWLVVAGSLVLASFAFFLTQYSTGQTGKASKDKAGKTDDSETKKEPKLEPPPAKFPERKDKVDGSQGIGTQVTLIDDQITKGWKDNKTYPSERCTDHEFIRRASLDILGRIPTVEEVNRFMKYSPPEKRRSWLIDNMLDGKDYGHGAEYANNFANLWTIHLITRTGSNQDHKNQLHEWLYYRLKGKETAKETPKSKSKDKEGAGAKGKDKDTETTSTGSEKKSRIDPDKDEPGQPDWSYVVRRLISGQGDTNTDNAVNFLLHNLGEEFKQDQNKNGQWDMVPATSRTTRLFLGIRTQCVQCHDHPFHDSLGQHHFWGMNAFLRQVESINIQLSTPGRPNPDAVKKKKIKGIPTAEFRMKDRKDFNANNLVGYERRNTVYLFIDPTFLDGRKLPKNYTGNRREKLAEFIVTSPDFAKAYVNRMWGHFFGKSFTKDAADDFGEHNPVSHPELLDKLAKDWAKNYSHNPKTLIRWICNSQAYSLSSKANKWNDKPDDETLFARMLLKPMSPEQMFESLMLATGSPLSKKDEEKKEKAKVEWLSKLIVNFGNDEGEEGVYTGTVVQALLLINGQDINNAISDKKDGVVATIVAKRGASYQSLRPVITDLYLHILSRPPSAKELDDLVSPKTYNFFLKKGGGIAVPPNPATLPTQFWIHYYEDIAWALVNSNEFILNH